MSGTLEMLPGNIDFSNEQHSAVSIGISYFKFKIIPGKLFGDGEEIFSFLELGLIISGYVCRGGVSCLIIVSIQFSHLRF